MSLLSVCQQVLDLVGWDNFSTITSSTDKTARQIKALANQELVNTGNRFDWRMLVVEHEFMTVVGQKNYEVPNDFGKLIQDSVYNADEYYRLRSSMTERQWNAWQFGLFGSISHQRYRLNYINGSPTFTISPEPDEAQKLVFWYKTKFFVKDDSDVRKPKYELDDDVSIIPENVIVAGLLWRFRRAKGLDYSAELAEYNEIARTTFAQTRGESDLPVPNGLISPELTNGFVPDTGFG